MPEHVPISYANSIDPAGGIQPSKNVFQQPLSQPLDPHAAFNVSSGAAPERVSVPSDQVRQSQPRHDGPKPDQSTYNAGTAYAHISRGNADDARSRGLMTDKNAARAASFISPEALQQMNNRCKAAKEQVARIEAQKQDRKHGRKH